MAHVSSEIHNFNELMNILWLGLVRTKNSDNCKESSIPGIMATKPKNRIKVIKKEILEYKTLTSPETDQRFWWQPDISVSQVIDTLSPLTYPFWLCLRSN